MNEAISLQLLHDSTENAQRLDTCEPIDSNDEVRRSVSFPHQKSFQKELVGLPRVIDVTA